MTGGIEAGRAPGATGERATLSERVRIQQVAAMYGAGVTIVATLAAALVLVGVLVALGAVSFQVGALWFGYTLAQSLARLALILAYRRASPERQRDPIWGRLFSVGAAAAGLGWGIGGLWLLPPGRLDLQMLVMLIISSLVYGTLTAFGGYLPAFFAFFAPAMIPSVVWAVLQGDLAHDAYAVLAAIWIPTISLVAIRYNRAAVETLRLRFENQDLAEDLAAQKERAEAANLDKSRFLASASHDLRQPVHALGLFVGALRAHPTTPEAAKLLDHIESSVSALDDLFVSLLDISRLDAGVIQASPRAFAVGPMLQRVCRDLAGEAAAKGLNVRQLPSRAVVLSDPVLLERILRNLVANAVRHTEQGRVLVGVRRHGDRVSLEVSDTGPGIAPALREAVFQEFYQVANPGRDRAKGLGLGLAIVRRLTQLMDHPLTLRSDVGRGSTFSVSVPRASAADLSPAPTPQGALGPAGALVLVIDDERAIQDAMSGLLASWGHEAVCAGSLAEMLDSLAHVTRAPDLILCDYRLATGETGVEAIERLQSEFNEPIPAMLITGDTAPDRLAEARASGFVLLHKPVSNARLRAAIGNLLAQRAPADVD